MGIYDREYYRNDGPKFLDSFTNRGAVCKGLIVANVVVFLLQVMTLSRPAGEFSVTNFLELNSDRVWHFEVWRLITYAFAHDPTNPWHLFFNMWLLWMFGSDMEDHYGPREFLCFYLSSAVAGALAFVVAKPGVDCLGASGAVLATAVLCAFHYPTRTIILMFVLPIQLWLAVLLFCAFDAFTLVSGTQTRTAVSVHLAGAGFGYAYYHLHIRLLDYLPSLGDRTRPRRRNNTLRVYREDPPAGERELERERAPVASTTQPPPAAEVDEHLEAKLDAVLEKVARSGQSSLTEVERQILFRASEIYKKRRTGP